MEEKVINNLSCREITNVKKVYYIWYDNYLSIEKIKREELWRINKLNLKPDILPVLFNVDVDEWNWDESGDKTSNGGLVERQLKGFVPKQNEWVESYFNEMLRRPMCIFIETFDESVYLFGGESPRTTFTFTKSISSRNGYDLVFTCLSEESSLIVNDEDFFPAPPDTGLTCEPVTINLDGTDILIANSGSIVTINLEDTDENPVIPDDVQIVGDNIKLVFTVANYDLDLVDRFGNAFPTKQVSANATWDLRTLTPYDWADLYLTLINAGLTTPQEDAIIDFVTDQISSGIWQKRHVIYPYIGGTAVRHAVNMRYPFANVPSGQLTFLGSPTHDANGVTIVSNSGIISTITPKNITPNNLNVFHYSRTNSQRAGTVADWCANQFGVERHYLALRSDSSNTSYVAIGNGIATLSSANSDGGFHMNGGSGTNVSKLVRNGSSVIGTFTDGGSNNNFGVFTMGGGLNSSNAFTNNTLRNYAGWAIGERLTDTQIADDYAQWQTLQTAFSRQV